MRILGTVLLGIGGLAFLVGMISRVLGVFWMFAPGTYWKGAMGCAAFTIALVLMEIRDKPARPA